MTWVDACLNGAVGKHEHGERERRKPKSFPFSLRGFMGALEEACSKRSDSVGSSLQDGLCSLRDGLCSVEESLNRLPGAESLKGTLDQSTAAYTSIHNVIP